MPVFATDWIGPTIAAIVGALVAGLLTAFFTWRVSSRLNAETTYNRLKGAMWIIATELNENAERAAAEATPERARLTLGDWESCKVTLAGLVDHDEPLFAEVAKVYRRIYESQRDGADPAGRPSHDEMANVSQRLHTRRQEIRLKSWAWPR
jgi:hypothetical protein